jgi:hypothetical protein
MTTLHRLMMVTTLLVGGASFAVAQNCEATGGQPSVGGAGATLTTSPPTKRHQGTRHHRMYMISVNRTYKGSKLKPANQRQMKQ